MALNYKTDNLEINEIPVTCLTIVGVLVEVLFAKSRKSRLNFSGLQTKDLPATLALTIDGYKK